MNSKKIRVLVAHQPRLMRELLLATIADQPDIEVVAEIQDARDEGEVLRALQETLPDFLIVASDTFVRRPGFCGNILAKYLHIECQ